MTVHYFWRRKSAAVAILACSAAAALPPSTRVAAELCPPPPSNAVPCKTFASWNEFETTVETSTGDLVLCAGTILTKTELDNQATIKRPLRLACQVAGACIVSGPGRHINVKTVGGSDTVIQGIKFVWAEFTSVAVFGMSKGLTTFCENEFTGNSRPMDSQKGGGAIKADLGTNIVISGCKFAGNSARTGGAVSTSAASTLIVDSVFENNNAQMGGAIESRSSIEIGSSVFTGNSATDGTSSTVVLLGGGIGNWVDLGLNKGDDVGDCDGFYDGGACLEFIDEPNRIPETQPPVAAPAPTPLPRPAPTPPPTPSPTSPPTPEPTESTVQSPFQLGDLYTDGATGLRVARGLTIRRISRAGSSVPYANGQSSGACRFHRQPDGAATFHDPTINTDGGFHYCSNAEERNGGGVYCLVFDGDCNVRDYVKRLGGSWDDGCGDPPGGFITDWNCNGGATPWNTWVSCEEVDRSDGGGYCWQVDPYGRRQPQEISRIGKGEWEAMTVDPRRTYQPVFYFTEDDPEGAIRQFTPAESADVPGWDTLHPSSDNSGELKYLVFSSSNTFYWSTDVGEGRRSAREYYPHVEGIAFMEVRGMPTLFYVAKTLERLFTLNLNDQTYSWQSTNAENPINGGSFTASPDHLMVVGSKFLWHSEDGGGTPGSYIKDLWTQQYYTIFQDDNPVDGEETTGIAVSPDGRCMIGCLQEKGECYTFKREDGGSLEHLGLRMRIR